MFDMKNLRNLSADDLLGLLGVQRRRGASAWLWPALGVFGAGVVVGAGAGLFLAPKSGKQLRHTLAARLHPEEHPVKKSSFDQRPAHEA